LSNHLSSNYSIKLEVKDNLTPCIPLSFKGEGEDFLKEGLTPLLDAPLSGWGEKATG
jgi:hypothetical protein